MQTTRRRTPRRKTDSRRGNYRTAAALVALTVVVVSAGCSIVGAGLPLAAPAPYTETGAELNGTDLRAAHLSGLEEAESFRSDATLVLQGDAHAFGVDRSAAVDQASNRSRSVAQYDSDAVEGDGLVVASYTAGNATYRQVAIDAGQQTITRYDAAREPYADGLLAVQPVNRSAAANAGLVAAVADDVNWSQRGVERYDGGWVTRYEASGPENFSAIGSTAVAAGESDATERTELPETLALDVSTINATLLVSPDGVVRRFHVHAVGSAAGGPAELTLTVTTDGLGTTRVERPAWIDEARTRTSV